MNRVVEILETMASTHALEDDAPAREWLDRHKRRFSLFIDGGWHLPEIPDPLEATNPATNAPLATLARAGSSNVELAVRAARRVQSKWSARPGPSRARPLYALARLLHGHAGLLAMLETLDSGQPIRESRELSIPLAARQFHHFAGRAQLWETEPRGMAPVGVVAQIHRSPAPLRALAMQVAPAIAAGNAVIVRPPPSTSLCALAFADLCIQAGLPGGVVNVVTGDDATEAALVEHPAVNMVVWTGPTASGKAVREATAGSGKRLALALSGTYPSIVFDDADLDSAVDDILNGLACGVGPGLGLGQLCCAGSRLLVQESVADLVLAKLRARMQILRVGNPLDPSVDVGPVASADAVERLTLAVDRAVREGATLARSLDPADLPAQGHFFPPTLLAPVEPASTAAQAELDGPVLVATTFRTPDEAVALANNTRYSLAASIWSESVNVTLGVASQLKTGTVWINCTHRFDAACEVGGVDGFDGLYAYLEPDFTAGLPTYPCGAPLETGDLGLCEPADVQGAIDDARAQTSWRDATASTRSQVLANIAQNLEVGREAFVRRLQSMTEFGLREADSEVDAAIRRLLSYSAWADTCAGPVRAPARRMVAITAHEPVGIIGIACPDERPLLSFLSLVAPAIAAGNRVVAVPSQQWPRGAADLRSLLRVADLPTGVINLAPGPRAAQTAILAGHGDIDALWYVGPEAGSRAAQTQSAATLKRTWVNGGRRRDWMSAREGEGREFLREAVRAKTTWIPYGE